MEEGKDSNIQLRHTCFHSFVVNSEDVCDVVTLPGLRYCTSGRRLELPLPGRLPRGSLPSDTSLLYRLLLLGADVDLVASLRELSCPERDFVASVRWEPVSTRLAPRGLETVSAFDFTGLSTDFSYKDKMNDRHLLV